MLTLRQFAGRLAVIITLLLLTAPQLYAQNSPQRGQATYYSRRSNGARTSSGIRLNNDSLVCAHRTHPFGTLLRVRNINNGKEVVVKVIDRGPFGKGKIIDLSIEAARRIGMLSAGVVPVEVTVCDARSAMAVNSANAAGNSDGQAVAKSSGSKTKSKVRAKSKSRKKAHVKSKKKTSAKKKAAAKKKSAAKKSTKKKKKR